MWTHTHTHTILPWKKKSLAMEATIKARPLLLVSTRFTPVSPRLRGTGLGRRHPILPQELKPLGRLLGLVMLVGSVICE